MSDEVITPAEPPITPFVQAYHHLRDLIIAGHFEPNFRLTEADLTKLLDVSRGTVRSVTAKLAQEGYLTSEPHRGVRTRDFSIEEAISILEAREVLESALAAKAAVSATDAELEDLTDICEKMAVADRDKAASDYSQLNRQFHRQVRKSAQQPTLDSFVDALHYPLVMRQYRDLTTVHPRQSSLSEHRTILYSLKTRNADAASAAMRHHVAAARRALLINVDEKNSSSGTGSNTG
ncbi:DNA-binding transcriptional regulator, GntR family [Brevibacterium siliguriense]|uniref:DNA-binding transcriptional regulator, GntR family n=1 Tax=Brevibacterium siliguriense TaxID=1136497 RepID=A0A1H1SU44_9MICO|nr:GntR family transcriptional regulator [Brevibacterium siliguriense]SDS51557.1 DNA-binding transcriptional regulator, GntR family [Brevibacterium siliguriense]